MFITSNSPQYGAPILLPVLLGKCANGVAADDDDAKGGFTVFELPHIRASVVLTTLRSGLLGSHIFALTSGDIITVWPPLKVESNLRIISNIKFMLGSDIR